MYSDEVESSQAVRLLELLKSNMPSSLGMFMLPELAQELSQSPTLTQMIYNEALARMRYDIVKFLLGIAPPSPANLDAVIQLTDYRMLTTILNAYPELRETALSYLKVSPYASQQLIQDLTQRFS